MQASYYHDKKQLLHDISHMTMGFRSSQKALEKPKLQKLLPLTLAATCLLHRSTPKLWTCSFRESITPSRIGDNPFPGSDSPPIHAHLCFARVAVSEFRHYTRSTENFRTNTIVGWTYCVSLHNTWAEPWTTLFHSYCSWLGSHNEPDNFREVVFCHCGEGKSIFPSIIVKLSN